MNGRPSPVVVALLLVTSACAARRTDVPTPGQPANEAALVGELRDIAGTARQRFSRVSELAFNAKSYRGDRSLDPGLVASLGMEPQRILLARLTRREFGALKDYAALQFPSPPRPDIIDPFYNLPSVSHAAAVAYANSVKAFIERLTSLRSISVNIDINTSPSEADVRLRTSAVTLPASRTDTTLKNVYRGWYSFEITKPAFKTASGTLDLVNDDRRSLTCFLGAVSDPTAQSSCRRR